MSSRDHLAAAADGAGGSVKARPAGLPEKLMVAIRPEFRADVLVFDPRDPVFGGPPCAVSGCDRPARSQRMCWSHQQRWYDAGKPDLAVFAATTSPDWTGHKPVASCQVAGCRFGRHGQGMCVRHAGQWKRAGRPDLAAWLISAAPLPPPSPQPRTCRVGYCELWTQGRSELCLAHGDRWRVQGHPDIGRFTADCDGGGNSERIDLRRLRGQLRLEVQYVLQCRHGEQRARLIPRKVQRIVQALASTELRSMLDWPEESWEQFGISDGGRPKERGWRAFGLDAYHRIEVLAFGCGWDVEYPRDRWRLRNLGVDGETATISFAGIPQPWLTDLAKRWARWRLASGTGPSSVALGVRALARFAIFLASPPAGVDALAQIDRAVIERYLADLGAEFGGRKSHGQHIGALSSFVRAVRQHGWASTLPATAAFFPDDYPRRGEKLPRALAGHVMAQVEQPGNLDRWDNPAYRLITLILMRCGLRVSDAAKLPFDCIACDADGAPYLRYRNRKMKREALVPIDDELRQQLLCQQQVVLQRWPAGAPVLFPRVTGNLRGDQPIKSSVYRRALYRWLEDCDVRDEHGRPVRLRPHQWRHTLGTHLINRDVPQEVVRRILDHDSAEMTALYAVVSDTTIRRHWEASRKVNANGETVTLDPDGPLTDASWAKQRLSRATQALPNGVCGLPLVQTCPHANACLTCPLFITTSEFLPHHREQHRTTLQIISAAEARGQTRVAQMNRQVAGNLEKIITALEAGDDEPEAAADAS